MNKLNNKVIVVFFVVFLFGIGFGNMLFTEVEADNLNLDYQEATIRAIQIAMPAVVSVVIYEDQNTVTINSDGSSSSSIEEKKVGSGSGFLISANGLILTNKHVVNASNGNGVKFKIILNDGKEYSARVVGEDILNDVAVLRIFGKDLPYLELGDTDDIPVGLTVMAIGNSLGRYQNSVTKGIISGVGRTLVASDEFGNVENLTNILQTDAEINVGNSGGPLINLEGKVIGINVAVDKTGESIGFAIPINTIKPVIESVLETGRIIRPRLGVRYIMIDEELLRENDFSRKTGAVIIKGLLEGEYAVAPNSPAMKAGLWEGDIIYEVDGIVLDSKNILADVVQKKKPGDKIILKIDRRGQELTRTIILDEFKFK